MRQPPYHCHHEEQSDEALSDQGRPLRPPLTCLDQDGEYHRGNSDRQAGHAGNGETTDNEGNEDGVDERIVVWGPWVGEVEKGGGKQWAPGIAVMPPRMKRRIDAASKRRFTVASLRSSDRR